MEARGSVRTTPTSASTSQTPRQSATLQRAQKRTSSTTSLLRSYALSSSAVEYSSAGAEGSPSEAVGIKGVSDAAIDDARGVNSFYTLVYVVYTVGLSINVSSRCEFFFKEI